MFIKWLLLLFCKHFITLIYFLLSFCSLSAFTEVIITILFGFESENNSRLFTSNLLSLTFFCQEAEK